MKRCPQCSSVKSVEGFYVRPNGNLQSWCIDCTKALRLERQPKNTEYMAAKRKAMTEAQKALAKDYQLQYNFGISLDDYQAMLREQNNCCAICYQENGVDRRDGDKRKQLSVDHDHGSGRVRGLLCNDCNRGIGQLGDSLPRLRAAVAYLERYQHLQARAVQSADELLAEILKGTSS